MQIGEYLKAYQDFYREFFPDATPEMIKEKLLDEICELEMADMEHEVGGPFDAVLDEMLDVMNLAILNVFTHISKDPLQAGWEKLQRTRRKYLEFKESAQGHCDRINGRVA